MTDRSRCICDPDRDAPAEPRPSRTLQAADSSRIANCHRSNDLSDAIEAPSSSEGPSRDGNTGHRIFLDTPWGSKGIWLDSALSRASEAELTGIQLQDELLRIAGGPEECRIERGLMLGVALGLRRAFPEKLCII